MNCRFLKFHFYLIQVNTPQGMSFSCHHPSLSTKNQ